MSGILEEIYIITSERDYLPFFNRTFGDSGRDIAAVKMALGGVYTNTLDGEQPVDNSIGTSWFECGSNAAISNENLKKFDKKLRLDLMAFQMKYHFVIVSYYFEKYGVFEAQTKTELEGKVTGALNLFDAEFGSIGEGTIAVLHGWRPNSVAYNYSFVSEVTAIVDEVPNELYSLVESGIVQEPPSSIVTGFFKFGNSGYTDNRDLFNQNSHAGKKFSSRIPDVPNPVYALYTPSAVGAEIKESQLFVAAKSIMQSSLERDVSELSAEDRYRTLAPMLEPDHLTDPAPFFIGGDKIGFFDRTEYTLENLPNFGNLDPEYVKQIEHEALAKILRHYNKPLIWNMSGDLSRTDVVSFTTEESEQAYRSQIDSYSVTTRTTITEYNLEPGDYTARYIDDLQSLNAEKVITFVNFRTPSLRPGDVYRAYFEVSRNFLDKIETGIFGYELEQSRPPVSEGNSNSFDEATENLESEYCVENTASEEETMAKIEKYRAFAMKKKLEISREVRNKAIIAAAGNNAGINVDLGVFGNIPIASLLDDISLGEGALTSAGADFISNFLAGALPPNPPANPLEIHLSDLEEGLTQLTNVFKSEEAKKDISSFKIRGTDNTLDLDREAGNLSQFVPELKRLVYQNEEFAQIVKASETTIDTVLEEKRSGFSGTLSGTKILISFSENNPPRITKIQIQNDRYFPSDKPKIYDEDAYEPLTGVLSIPRTVNYVRNIYNMIPLGVDNWKQTLEQLVGIGSKPCSDDSSSLTPGAGIIMRYTINSDGKILEFDKEKTPYNPLHNWKEDLQEREEVKRISDAYDYLRDDFISWGNDIVLPQIGPNCTLDELYRDVINKLNLSKLLCDFISCLRLPGVNVKLPSLELPEIPEIPIFQMPGLDGKKIWEQIEAVLLQALCAFVRNLLDILSSPFCQEQIINDLYGAASNVSPDIQRAFGEALVDTGVPKEKNSNASSLISDAVNFLTPREICALLSGQPVNRQVYNIIQNLAKNYGLSEELDSKEKIVVFFESIGIYVPDELCSRLAQTDNLLGTQTCEDTATLLSQIRNAASRGPVSPERVQQAVDAAEANIMDKAKAYQLFMGDFGLSDMLPQVDSSKVQENRALQESSKVAVESALSLAKRTFISSMSSYIPSMYLDVSSLVSIDDPEYDPIATMRFLRATNNLQKISGFDVSDIDFESQGLTLYLRRTLLALCDDFEKVQYGDFQVYRSQLVPVNINELTSPDDIQASSSASRQEALDASPDERDNFAAYEGIVTSLKGSLVFGHDISDEGRENGLLALFDYHTPDERIKATLNDEYANIFSSLFPLYLDVIEGAPQPGEDVDPLLSTTPTTVTLNNWPAWWKDEYRGNLGVEAGEEGRGYSQFNVSLNVSYLKAIGVAVNKLQTDIEQNVEKVFKVVQREELLEVIKDFYNIELEAQRQEEILLGTFQTKQLIKTEATPSGQHVVLEHPTIGLMRTRMLDKTVSSDYISNQTEIDDGFFLGTPDNPKEVISICEDVPDQYKGFFDSSRTENPLRKKVFKQQLTDIARHFYNDYRLPDMQSFNTVADLDLLADSETEQYNQIFEGTIEQLVSYMGESRLFSDPGYLQRLDSKIKSRSYIDVQGDNACIINPRNTFSQGPVKFEELVSSFFPDQYMKELMDPSNSIFTIDYSKPGPFEKAMMSTTLLGFIRVTCLEALLKGAISYSTWDIDFVSSDPLFFKYMCILVENAIEKESGFQKYEILVDDAFRKIAGTNNRKTAIRKILNVEMTGYISTLSKVLFENKPNEDYFNWFLSQMQIVNAPYKRRLDTEEELWVSELKESDINKFRKNSFTFLERYVRTNGEFQAVLGAPSGLARRQQQALYDFIGFDGSVTDISYPSAFKNKIYNTLGVPITLDVPTKRELLSFNIDSENNITEVTLDGDTDSWPDRELWSLKDFNDLIAAIFSNNTGVEKFIFHLLKKYHDPTDLTWHGRPKTLRKKLPIKTITRKRTYYRFEDKNLFSSKLSEDFDPVVPQQGSIAPQERSNDSRPYYDWITEDFDPNRERISTEGGGIDLSIGETIEYNDRYYILSANGRSLFEETTNRGLVLEQRYDSNGGDYRSPARGLTLSKELGNGEKVSPWQELETSQEVTDPEHMSVIMGRDGNNVDPSIRGRTIFENKSGQVSEDFFNRFNQRVGDVIESETWEEYVIDLVDQASPIFNQIGESNYDTEQAFSNDLGARQSIATSLKHAATYIKKPDPGAAAGYGAHRDVLCRRNEDQTRDRTTVMQTNETEACEEGHPLPNPTEAFPIRGPGFVDLDQGIEGKVHQASGYAFFNNDIKIQYDPASENYRLDSKSHELLGENDYKIPLRIIITQVKDSSGNIKQCFARYVIPETMTFGETNKSRVEELEIATKGALDGYANFIENAFRKGLEDNNPINQTYRDWEYLNRNALPETPALRDLGLTPENVFTGQARVSAVNWLLGRRGDSDEESSGHVPVLYRMNGGMKPNNNSKGVEFVSIEKIWSQAAQVEARARTRNFTVDAAQNEYQELDKFFEHNIGNLIRKETGQGLPLNTIVSQIESIFNTTQPSWSQTNFEDGEFRENYLQNFLSKRYLAYDRASKHFFYENSVSDLINTNEQNKGLKSIGALVSWFSQRRVDAFYGATSVDVKGGTFTKAGTTQGIIVDPNSATYLAEAADYDCGPSLFYGDRRILAESYMASLRQEIEESFDGFPNSAKVKAYRDNLEAFRIQNAHKVNVTTAYNQSIPSDFDAPAAQIPLAERYKKRFQKSKTLVTQNTDVHLSAFSLQQMTKDARDETQKSPIAQSLFNLRKGYVHPNLFFADVTPLETVMETMTRFNIQGIEVIGGGKDTILHLPDQPIPLTDKMVTDQGFMNIPIHYSSVSVLESAIDNFSKAIANRNELFSTLDIEKLTIILERLSADFDQSLRWADPLLDALRNILAGLNPEAVSFLESLDIRHGMRLNLVLDHDINVGSSLKTTTSQFIEKIWNEDSQVGEEERTGRVYYEADLSQNKLYEKYVTVPLASHERPLASIDICEPNSFVTTMIPTILSRDSEMIKSLSQEENFKSFYEFSVPYRRLASLLTVHSTSMLAGYNNMPTVLTSTKAALAATFSIMAERNNFDAIQENQFGRNFSNVDILNAMGQDFPAGGEPPECFENIFDDLNGQFFKMISEMIKDFIYYFPAVIFRGIADQLDPAYREMKSHYYACEVDTLQPSTLGLRGGDGDNPFGLRGSEPGRKNYIPVNTGFPVDSAIGITRLLTGGGGAYLGKSISKLVAYIVGGPRQLIDPSYAFQIPCVDNVQGEFRNWDKYAIGDHGRYGHPLSLFTLLALPTPMLPRDKEYKNQVCTRIELSKSGIVPTVCSDNEE